MNDNLIKARQEQRAFGVSMGEDAICACGARYTAHDEIPGICPECSNRMMAAHAIQVEKKKAIGRGSRPRWIRFLDKDLYRHCAEAWLWWARIRTGGRSQPARVRNRCKHCGARSVKDVGGPWCLRCRTIHRLCCLRRDIKDDRMNEGRLMAGRWGLSEDFERMAGMSRTELDDFNIWSAVAVAEVDQPGGKTVPRSSGGD